jgi:adenosylcobyric acid synthase
VTPDTAFDGAIDAVGNLLGTYIHGLFHNAELRHTILVELARRKGIDLPDPAQELSIDREFDKLADWVRGSLDMELVYRMTGLVRDFQQAPLPG